MLRGDLFVQDSALLVDNGVGASLVGGWETIKVLGNNALLWARELGPKVTSHYNEV